MENKCSICNKRISDWMIAGGKVTRFGENLVHKTCLLDLKLRLPNKEE